MASTLLSTTNLKIAHSNGTLLSRDNTKINRSNKGYGESPRYFAKIQHFAPAKESGYEVCANRSPGCSAACLYTAGHGVYDNVKEARIKRTLLFFQDRQKYKKELIREIGNFVKLCRKKERLPAVRLNGTSDIIWEKIFPELFELFPDVQFYDYTKHVARFNKSWVLPKNYHLTFSKSETNNREVNQVLRNGGNVAVVFEKLPKTYKEKRGRFTKRLKVIDGDKSDFRFLDKKNVIVGLTAKGAARKDQSGFVVLGRN